MQRRSPVKFGAFVAPGSPGVDALLTSVGRFGPSWPGKAAATALAAGLAAWLAGRHGAVSPPWAVVIAIAGCLAFAWLVARNRALTADGILLTALRAEAVKMLVLFVLLALVLATYKNVVVVALIGSFIVSIRDFRICFFCSRRLAGTRIAWPLPGKN